MSSFSLCVYCGSRGGEHPSYARAADEIGRRLARQGGRLVYGGGRVGLMGVVADAVLAEGGEVVGVIPQTLMDREVGHPGLTELHVVQTMHERKRLMAERADAFLALPGGIGTFEELFEVWTWRQLGYHDKPVGLLNVQGYYDGLLGFLGQTVAQGFLSPAQHEVLQVGTDPAALLEALRTQAQQANAPDDYRKI
jgi:uncharacterized protein (TIGR00730 family)